MDITGRKLFVKALREEKVDTVFAYPGGMITDIIDELYKCDDIHVVLGRHEQAVIHEAEGYARATGRVGVALVTSGPGATNTITGIADAHFDSIPLMIFTGQVPLGLIGNDAFQEVDIVGMTRTITKYSVTVRDRASLAKTIKMGFQICNTGKPGPVVIDIPKDIQNQTGDPEYPTYVDIRGYKPNESVHVGQLKKAYKMLKTAERPLILAGGGVRVSGAQKALLNFVEKTHIPVVTTLIGKGVMPENHEYYIGNSGMHGRFAANKAISECDLLFSIGTRFNDRITGDLSEFAPKAKIIHIDVASESISRNVVVDVPITADAGMALEKLIEWSDESDTTAWMERINRWQKENPLRQRSEKSNATGINPQFVMEKISEIFSDAHIVTDVGQHQMWAGQYIKLSEGQKFITSGGLGTMGFGFPAAVGAKIGTPNTPVVCITGDGGFQMNMQEMATAMIEGAPVVVCILNNSYLGMVRQMQQLFYGKRYEITSLRDTGDAVNPSRGTPDENAPYYPDFVKWAESYGAKAVRITEESKLEAALKDAHKEKVCPTVIEIIISPDELVLPMVKSGNPISEMILKA